MRVGLAIRRLRFDLCGSTSRKPSPHPPRSEKARARQLETEYTGGIAMVLIAVKHFEMKVRVF